MSKHQSSLVEYADDLRWAEYGRRLALPIAGSVGVALVALLLWGLWTLTYALL